MGRCKREGCANDPYPNNERDGYCSLYCMELARTKASAIASERKRIVEGLKELHAQLCSKLARKVVDDAIRIVEEE